MKALLFMSLLALVGCDHDTYQGKVVAAGGNSRRSQFKISTGNSDELMFVEICRVDSPEQYIGKVVRIELDEGLVCCPGKVTEVTK